MLYWLLSSFFSSLALVFWKKSMNYWIRWFIFSFFWSFWDIVWILWFLIFSLYNFSGLTNTIFFLTLFWTLVSIFNVQLAQYIYQNEKVSILTPYENLNKIFSVIIAFFVFSEVSLRAFLITLIWAFVLIWTSIDVKNFKIPKVIKLMFLYQVLISLNLFITVYILKSITNIDFFILWNINYLVILILIILLKKDFKQLIWVKKEFFYYRLPAWFFWSIWVILNIFIISTLWATISILFSYFYIWMILVFSSLILKDKPSRKNIIITIILSILVWLWYFLR